jgi:hypothetical protein
MKKISLALLLFVALTVCGCTSAFSLWVDGRPEVKAAQVSQRLAAHYAALGYSEVPELKSQAYKLGAWYSRQRGFIGHADRDGALWIWIAPRAQQDDASRVVADLKVILSKEAPEARVTIREVRSVDFR